MKNKLIRLLFPVEFREFPQQRQIINALRAIHIVCFSILVGGIFFDQANEFLYSWTIAVILSGFGMFALDLYNSFIALFEIRGIAILIKIIMLGLIPLTDGWPQLSILFLIIIFSSYISHTSRKIRHFNIMSSDFQQKFGIHSYNKLKKS